MLLWCNVLCMRSFRSQLSVAADKENIAPTATPPQRTTSAPLSSPSTPTIPSPRKYVRVSDEIRGIIIRLHDAGMSPAIIRVRLQAVLLPYSIATIYNVLSAWKRHKQMTHAPSTPRKPARSLFLTEHITALQDSNHGFTLAQIRALLPRRCSISHISRILRREKFTTKRLQKWDRNCENTKQLRVEFVLYAEIHFTQTNTIYIDESPFNISMTRGYGRSRIGAPCFIRVPLLRSPNYSVIAALSPANGIIFHHVKIKKEEG